MTRIWVRLRRRVGNLPAGSEGRVIPHDRNDRCVHIRVEFGTKMLKWYPPNRNMTPNGRAIRAARREMFRDCEVRE